VRQEEYNARQQAIYDVAQTFVLDVLKAPASAEFPPYELRRTGLRSRASVAALKLPALAPRQFDERELLVVSNLKDTVVLEGEDGSTFTVNKRTDAVSVTDASSGQVNLLINQSDYQDFMLDFLGN